MFFKAICAILSFVAFGVQVDGSQKPMVAFICNRPAMHWTDSGWVSDDSTGCLKDPTDILNYCRKVYPSLDIRNVIESNERATIGNWCDFGRTRCEEHFAVLPIHCLVGPFQSDALLVPEHCAFYHIHEPKLCALIEDWKVKSEKSCMEKGMAQHSYGMLELCGIGKFNGIEFVCCAKNQSFSSTSKGSNDEIPETKSRTSGKSDDFANDVNKPLLTHKWNEHEYYAKAKSDVKKYHHDKVAKMMKDWATARQRVESLKAIDQKASEKLSKEITSRFQMMYEAEEAERELERKQLEQLHNQRIQAQLTSREQQLFEDFMAAINDNNIKTSKVVRLLRRYIRALQKDRIHTVGVYTRFRETDPRSADDVRKQTMAQLDNIDRQLQKALQSVDHLSKQRNKIRKQIMMDLDNYHSLDDSISILLLKPLSEDSETKSTTTRPSTKATLEDDDYDDDDDVDDDDDDDDNYDDEDDDDDDKMNDIVKKRRENTSRDDYSEEDVKDYDEDDDDDDDEEEEEIKGVKGEGEKRAYEDKGKDKVKHFISSRSQNVSASSSLSSPSSPVSSVTAVRPFPGLSGDIDDDYLADYIHVRHNSHADNINRNDLNVQESYIHKAAIKRSGSFSSAVPLGIAVSAVTVFVVIIVGVVVMRRRVRRSRPSAVDVRGQDPVVPPEERHVAGMQVNGYENPTYKYFEGNVK